MKERFHAFIETWKRQTISYPLQATNSNTSYLKRLQSNQNGE